MSDTPKKFSFPKTLFSAVGAVLLLVILVLLNVVFSKLNLRIDATKENLYSLSAGSKKILSGIKQDVTIKVFYSKDIPNMPVQLKTYSSRVLDFLSEYEHAGKVKIEVYNPKPDSEEEDLAQRYGIEGIDLPGGDKLYFGLAAVAADQEESISTLDPAREEQLEYDITRLISRVQSPKGRTIGIISGIPVMGSPQMFGQRGMQPWTFVAELRKTYKVEELAPTSDKLDKDFDLLMIIHPKELSGNLQYAIDQHVMNGGAVLVFEDPAFTADAGGRPPQTLAMDKLFKAWGIRMDNTKLVMDFDHPTKLRNQQNQVEDNPLWISARKDSFNKDDMITAKLESVLMPMAGTIQKIPESKAEYQSLIKTGTNSMLTDIFKARLNAQMLRQDFVASNEKYDLAVRIRDTFKTAFPEGKPKDDKKKDGDQEKESPSAGHLNEGKKKATIIVVADSDLLQDDYYVSKQNFLGVNFAKIFNDNLNFVMNAAEVLTGSEDLIGIRSRGKFERPFVRVQELEKKAQAKWLSREQDLVRKAEDANLKLREFEQKKDPSQKFIISKDQEEEIRRFQEEKQRINKELKEVRRNLRSDIESLGTKLKFINIFLMPLLASVAGIFYAMYRRKKSLNAEKQS